MQVIIHLNVVWDLLLVLNVWKTDQLLIQVICVKWPNNACNGLGNKLQSLVISNDQMILQLCGNNDFSLLEGFIKLKYIFG